MDGKAIIYFVDETENPAVDENPYHFQVVGEEDADFAGGSYVFAKHSRYVKVKRSACEEQEKVILGVVSLMMSSFDEEKLQNA